MRTCERIVILMFEPSTQVHGVCWQQELIPVKGPIKKHKQKCVESGRLTERSDSSMEETGF